MLVDRIQGWAQSKPEKPALIDGDTVTSYADLARMIQSARHWLRPQKLAPGHIVILLSEGRAEEWAISLALRTLGVHTVCVAALTVADSLKIGSASAIVLYGKMLAHADALPKSLRGVRVITVPRSVLAEQGTAEETSSSAVGTMGGYVLYTSGTTGNYKKVFYDAAREDRAYRWIAEVFSFDGNTVFHAVDYPPWTAIGARTVSSVWAVGGCVVRSGKTDRFGDLFRHHPTHAILVPAMLARLLESHASDRLAAPDFVLGVTGGFLPLRMAELAASRITSKIDFIYGSTELTGLMRAAFRAPEDLQWLAPYHGNVVEVADADGRAAPVGAEGELRIRLRDFDPRGYLDDADATSRVFRGDYFYPGDLAVAREDGRIRILGRIEDVLNIRGFKVAVAPLEERIQRQLAIDNACIFAGLNEDGEEEVVIAVEREERLPERDLADAVRGIAGFERVRWVFVKSFPRTQGGMSKIDRRQLRALMAT